MSPYLANVALIRIADRIVRIALGLMKLLQLLLLLLLQSIDGNQIFELEKEIAAIKVR